MDRIEGDELPYLRDRGREGEAGFLERPHEREVQEEVGEDREHAHADRCLRVLLGVEGARDRRRDAARGDGAGEGDDDARRARRRLGAELSALEEDADDRLREHGEAYGAGERDEEGGSEGVVGRLVEADPVPARREARELGEDRRGDGDPDRSDRELRQAVREEDRRDAASARDEGVGDDRVHERVHLEDGEAEGDGVEEPPHARELLVARREDGVPGEPELPHGGHVERELDRSAEEERPGERVDPEDGIGDEPRSEEQGADPDDVEDAGRCGRGREVIEGVERPGEEARETDEDEVGEEDLREGEREVRVLEGIAREPGGDPPAGLARERMTRLDPREPADGLEDEDEHGEPEAEAIRGGRGEDVRLLGPALLARLDEDGDEGRRERALAEQSPEEVRERPRDEEGVGDRVEPELPRHDHVAGEPEEPGEHRERGDGPDAPQCFVGAAPRWGCFSDRLGHVLGPPSRPRRALARPSLYRPHRAPRTRRRPRERLP